MLDRLSNENHAAVLSEHMVKVAPELRRIEAAMASADGDRAALDRLQTMRVLLVSGLMDAEFYLRENPDLRQAGVDPLAHFVDHGDQEGRKPNAIFWPRPFLHPAITVTPSTSEPPPQQKALMCFKQALAARLGVEQGFDCYRRALGLSDGYQVRLKPLASLREVAERRPGAFFEAAEAGRSFIVPPPTAFGEGHPRSLESVTRSLFVACLIDARARGGSALIEVDELALLDYQATEPARLDDQLEFDPAVFRAAAGAAWIISSADDAPAIELDEAFTLLGPRTHGFAEWIWEYLAKYIGATAAHALPPVPILIDAEMPKANREVLALMLPQGAVIIDVPRSATVRVRRLWCASSEMYTPVLAEQGEHFRWDHLAPPPERFAAIIREMSRRADRHSSPLTGADRLFLANRDHYLCKLLNEKSVGAVAEARRFRVVDTGELDFAAQVDVFREARFIVAQPGAALFFALFAKPGTKLLVLHHPDTEGLTALAAVLREIGVVVTILTGPYVRLGNEHRFATAYQIDETDFDTCLDDWLGAGLSVDSARPARRQSGSENRHRGAVRVGAFLCVKDEVEIIGHTIEHLRRIGVDFVLACDVGSTDGALDVLEKYQSDWFSLICSDELEGDRPDLWAHYIAGPMEKAKVDWVMFLDADEYWLPASGNLKDCTTLARSDLLYVPSLNIPLGPTGPIMPDVLTPDRYNEVLLIVEPVPTFHTASQPDDAPWISGLNLPKVIARPERIGRVSDGTHDIVAADSNPLRWCKPADLVIAHLPFTTRTRFRHKIDNVRRFLALHETDERYFDPALASHWRRWVALADQGHLDEEFDRSIFDDEMIAALRSQGVIRSASEILCK